MACLSRSSTERGLHESTRFFDEENKLFFFFFSRLPVLLELMFEVVRSRTGTGAVGEVPSAETFLRNEDASMTLIIPLLEWLFC